MLSLCGIGFKNEVMIKLVLIISLLTLLVNCPLGAVRLRYKRFSAMWFVIIHVTAPLLVLARWWWEIPKPYVAVFIVAAIIGQLLGSRYGRLRIKERGRV